MRNEISISSTANKYSIHSNKNVKHLTTSSQKLKHEYKTLMRMSITSYISRIAKPEYYSYTDNIINVNMIKASTNVVPGLIMKRIFTDSTNWPSETITQLIPPNPLNLLTSSCCKLEICKVPVSRTFILLSSVR